MLDYRSILSDIQYKAVSDFEGATLVIAGAGSGKTRVLTYRIAYMIENGIAPFNILSLTFTNKAAGEMRERIKGVVSENRARSIAMGTFHSVFRRILKSEATAIGFTDNFTIYQTTDSRNLVKSIVREMNLDEKKYDPKLIFSLISKQKNNLVTPNLYLSNATLVAGDIKAGMGEFCNVYKQYMIRCKQNNAMDFDDLLLYTNILFKNNPEILAKYQQQYKYILVDEYQDTNSSQYLIIKKLAELHGNICVVGDDAQSIYAFRGAKIENILRFQKDYPSSKVIRLEENYRSTQTIVNAANSIIAKNSNQLKKNVFSNKEQGEKIALRRTFTDKEEAKVIQCEIEKLAKDGKQYGQMAILYRNNAQSKVIEDQLRIRQIPYKIHKGHSFYEHAEIKNLLAYARLICNPSDDEALKRIINFPARGIGNTSLDKIQEFATSKQIGLWNALTLFSLEDMGVKGGAVRSIRSFIELIETYQQKALLQEAYEVIYALLSDSGILSLYRGTNDPEKESAYQNIEELINSLKQQCEAAQKEREERLTLAEWIQDVILMTSEDESQGDEQSVENNKVTLMTIHSAKGLEYDTIFITGVEEGMFPSQRSVESIAEIEEERRLFYVAVTRAVNLLFISYSLSRYKWGSSTNTLPSRFISEIESKYFDNPDYMTAKGAYDNLDSDNDDSRGREPFRSRGSFGESSAPQFSKDRPRFSSPSTADRQSASTPPIQPTFGMKKVNSRSSEAVQVESNGTLSVGDKVRHERFGDGLIKSIESTGTDFRLCVDFENGGEKMLLQRFAKLKRL